MWTTPFGNFPSICKENDLRTVVLHLTHVDVAGGDVHNLLQCTFSAESFHSNSIRKAGHHWACGRADERSYTILHVVWSHTSTPPLPLLFPVPTPPPPLPPQVEDLDSTGGRYSYRKLARFVGGLFFILCNGSTANMKYFFHRRQRLLTSNKDEKLQYKKGPLGIRCTVEKR